MIAPSEPTTSASQADIVAAARPSNPVAAPKLQSDSDRGVSNSDNITRRVPFVVYDAIQGFAGREYLPGTSELWNEPVEWLMSVQAPSTKTCPISIDVEQLNPVPWSSQAPVTVEEWEAYVQTLVGYVEEYKAYRLTNGLPDVPVGFYQELPPTDWSAIGGGGTIGSPAWPELAEKSAEVLGPVVDYIGSYGYFLSSDFGVQKAFVQHHIDAVRSVDKPVYVWVWAEPYGGATTQAYVDANWSKYLQFLRDEADGIILFAMQGSGEHQWPQWNPQASWLEDVEAIATDPASTTPHARLTFEVTGAPYFRFYRNGVQISGDAESGTTYTVNETTDGTFRYTYRTVNASGAVSRGASPVVKVTVDSAAPSKPVAPVLQGVTAIAPRTYTTSSDTLTFSVVGPYFRFYRDGMQISGNFESGTTYTITESLNGTHIYSYKRVDAAGNVSASSANVTVAIIAASTAQDDSFTLLPGRDQAIDVLANDARADATQLQVISVGPAQHGTTLLDASGKVHYTPEPGSFGKDSFVYTMNNEAGMPTTATVSLTIVPYGDANMDGSVTDADYTVWANNYRRTGALWSEGDFSGDGNVSDADYLIWATNYGLTVTQPVAAAIAAQPAAADSPEAEAAILGNPIDQQEAAQDNTLITARAQRAAAKRPPASSAPGRPKVRG